ncbi:MAG: hypothetical protein V1872_13195 [bacterium]
MSFSRGFKLFGKKDYREAAPYLYDFVRQNSIDVADHDWAEFFLGVSLYKSGFSHAAVDTLSYLIVRKPNPKIVSYSLEILEEISRTTPFDRDLLIFTVICDQEYGTIDKKLGDFINFYQGVYDWENGFLEWGDTHFKKITPKTYYYYKYLYHNALYKIYQDRLDESIIILNEILESEKPIDDLKNEALKTLARLAYEKGEFKKADTYYQKINKPIFDQAENLLERGWGYYRLGKLEEGLGLLYAFNAPSFKEYFTPEFYILKSFIYKDVCHYRRALSVVNEFKTHYKTSLKSINARGKPLDDPPLLLVLLTKKDINLTWRFLRLLEEEKKEAKKLQNKILVSYLEKIYNLEIEKIVKTFKNQIEKDYEKTANELLKYEEEANLLEYEIGLDIYKMVGDYQLDENPSKKDERKIELKKVVIYPFQEEFWNDELTNYKVILPSKCSKPEQWDMFFNEKK